MIKCKVNIQHHLNNRHDCQDNRTIMTVMFKHMLLI